MATQKIEEGEYGIEVIVPAKTTESKPAAATAEPAAEEKKVDA